MKTMTFLKFIADVIRCFVDEEQNKITPTTKKLKTEEWRNSCQNLKKYLSIFFR